MEIKSFKAKKELETELCHEIVSVCEAAINQFGHAHILLSGGSTPLALYHLLGKQKLDFSKIKIGLVDERYIELNSEFNNQKKIQSALNENVKNKIEVIGMALDMSNAKKNIELCNLLYQPFVDRIDFCLLGMGEDGHTASIFPNDLESMELLTHHEPGIFYSKAPSFPFIRISCNKAMLLNAQNISLMLIGNTKIKILNTAQEKNLPIAHFTGSNKNFKIYFSEK